MDTETDWLTLGFTVKTCDSGCGGISVVLVVLVSFVVIFARTEF